MAIPVLRISLSRPISVRQHSRKFILLFFNFDARIHILQLRVYISVTHNKRELLFRSELEKMFLAKKKKKKTKKRGNLFFSKERIQFCSYIIFLRETAVGV